ncbi:MAG: hypothetical protein KGO22_19750 [Gammaproteobacteria bacterium]|nr:hypothetical protein [Gammaproteobacteria bacterium]
MFIEKPLLGIAGLASRRFVSLSRPKLNVGATVQSAAHAPGDAAVASANASPSALTVALYIVY